MRFYLIDRITNIEIGKTVSGIKCWTITDEIFTEHFPGFPVVPGVLLTESMSQLLGYLIEKSSLEKFPNEKEIGHGFDRLVRNTTRTKRWRQIIQKS